MKNQSLDDIFSKVIAVENCAFLVDEQKFESNLNELRSSFLEYYPNVEIGYSYKTNYLPTLCRLAHRIDCWAEVVSPMEVEMALHHLEDKSKIIYNGPIKSIESIRKIIDIGGIINVDDIGDIKIIEKSLLLNPPINGKIKLALRVNLAFDMHPSRFGIEIERITEFIDRIEKNTSLSLQGYHIHLPFRSIESFEFRMEFILKILKIHGDRPIEYINVGGGFYGKISPELAKNLKINNPPSYSDYGRVVGETLTKHFNILKLRSWPKLFLEPGSSVVADAVWFISRIHSLKKLNSNYLLISYAGRHLLSPTNSTLMFPINLYTKSDSELTKIKDDISVVGFTCIESDVLGFVTSKFKSSSLDFVAFSNVGSYSIVLGSNFILPQPAIYKFNKSGIRIVRQSKTTKSILSEFID